MAVKILYDVIKEKRSELGLSQQDLSEQTGINVNTIKALETGRMNTTFDNIDKICERLSLNVDDVYLKNFRQTKVISVANNKGGCGKSSSVSSLAYSFGEMGYKVLVVDGDMQMNVSSSFGQERNKEVNLNTAILQETSCLEKYISKTDFENIDIIISDFAMAEIEQSLFTMPFRESIVKIMFKPLIDMGIYDFIIIDTNPTLGILNFNILNASDYVIVPVEMTAFGVMGLEIILGFIKKVRKANPDLKLLGVLKTKVDLRENITKEVDSVLNGIFGDEIFNTFISIDTSVKKAQWARTPLQLNTRAKKQYFNLAKEVLTLV